MSGGELVDVALRLVQRAENLNVEDGDEVLCAEALVNCEDALNCLYAVIESDEGSHEQLREQLGKQAEQLSVLVTRSAEMREENEKLMELLESPVNYTISKPPSRSRATSMTGIPPSLEAPIDIINEAVKEAQMLQQLAVSMKNQDTRGHEEGEELASLQKEINMETKKLIELAMHTATATTATNTVIETTVDMAVDPIPQQVHDQGTMAGDQNIMTVDQSTMAIDQGSTVAVDEDTDTMAVDQSTMAVDQGTMVVVQGTMAVDEDIMAADQGTGYLSEKEQVVTPPKTVIKLAETSPPLPHSPPPVDGIETARNMMRLAPRLSPNAPRMSPMPPTPPAVVPVLPITPPTTVARTIRRFERNIEEHVNLVLKPEKPEDKELTPPPPYRRRNEEGEEPDASPRVDDEDSVRKSDGLMCSKSSERETESPAFGRPTASDELSPPPSCPAPSPRPIPVQRRAPSLDRHKAKKVFRPLPAVRQPQPPTAASLRPMGLTLGAWAWAAAAAVLVSLLIMMRRAMLRAQLRGHKELADKMRAHGIDETVAFHEERKGLLEEKYHYRDYTGDKDPRFDKRLDVYQQIYEEQEMDGGCRYMMQKEQEAAEDKIYKMAVRRGEPIGPEEHVRIAARIEEAKARVLRRYKGIDADLRSGDPYCEQKAKEYLQHVAVDGAQHKWDYARAAHKRYQASLLGTQEDERRVKADNEMEGRPDADGETLAAFDNVGFMEQDEFDMLRREVGEEIADEYVVNIQKAREEVARKRLQHVSDRKKLNQLEKKMVLQEYKTVFENGYKEHRRRDGAAQNLSESLARTKEYEDFENEHSLSGEHDLNRQSHEMMASMRQKRAEVIKNRNKGKPMPEVNAYWEATAGSVQNPTRGFVDPDWWELATDDPRLKRHYREAMRQDARQVRKETDAVTLRKQAGDDVLAAMESFNDHRKDTFSRGYSKSQVLAYDDPETNEPRNKHIEDFLGTSVATGLPREREFTRESLLRWEYEVAAARRNSSGKRGTELPEN